MSRQFLTEFIQTYRDSPCLWKFSSKEHTNKAMREAAYDRLVKVAELVYEGATRDFVAKKISSLRGTYRKEMKKVEQSVLDGGVQYVPKLWYYEMMSFIRDDEYGVTTVDVKKSDKQVLVFAPVKEEHVDNPLMIDEGSKDSLSELVIDESSDNCSSNTKEESERHFGIDSEESSMVVNVQDIELLPDIQSRAFGNNVVGSESEPESESESEPELELESEAKQGIELENHLKEHLVKDTTRRQWISAKIKECILEKRRNVKQPERVGDDAELFLQFKTLNSGPKKRGRGRPPKIAKPEVDAKRKRGRPPKPPPTQQPTAKPPALKVLPRQAMITRAFPRRKPGRPRKIRSVEEEVLNSSISEQLPTVVDEMNNDDSASDISSTNGKSTEELKVKPIEGLKGIKVKKINELQATPEENGIKIIESTENQVKQISLKDTHNELDSEKSNPTEIYKNILNEFDAFVAEIDAGLPDKVPKLENGSPDEVRKGINSKGFHLEVTSKDGQIERSVGEDIVTSIPELPINHSRTNAKKRKSVDTNEKESDIANAWHKKLRTMRHEQVELAQKLIDQVLRLGCNDRLTHGTSIKFL